MTQDIDISVVVATRDRSRGCERLGHAVAAQFGDAPHLTYELLLVVDGCPVYDWVDTTDWPVKVVHLPDGVGIARARNAGIAASKGGLVAFLDDDCVPAATWLADLERMTQSYPERIAFGGRVLGTEGDNLWSQLRDAVYYFETFGPWYTDPEAPGDNVDVPYVNGGNSAYRRGPLVSSGGFDPWLPAYSDVELGRRLALRDRAVLGPGMAIHHDHPNTFDAYMRRCWRSGAARALLWAHLRHSQDSPVAVLRSIVWNVVWNNPARRVRRVNALPVWVLAALLCQEVVHGFGYACALAGRPGVRRTDGGADGAALLAGRRGRL